MKLVFWLLCASVLHAQAFSEWAFPAADHRLHYLTDSRGNSIMDFSSAGYRAGGVELPSVIVAQRLTPAPGDNTARIQAALDRAGGAVVLAPGGYEIAGTLSIAHSGVVLRGETGAGIRLTGKPHGFLEIRGTGAWREEGSPAPVLDSYVPAGATSFRVSGASAFHPGDRVLVLHPVTKEWIRFMGMTPSHDWVHPGSVIRTDRMIESVEGERVTLDVPLSDALDSRFTAASLVRYSFPGRIREVGVEGFRITAAFEHAPEHEPSFPALSMDAVEDAWARDLEFHETRNGVAIGPRAKRVTLASVTIAHSSHSDSAAPADFALAGTQILLDRCRVSGGGASPVVTQGETAGPLVVLNFTADHGGVAPRQGWTTGVLVDGGTFPGATEQQPGVAFGNTDIGWAVAWNVSSPYLLVEQPPGALNWCIGCIGAPVTIGGRPSGIFDSPGKRVIPSSLYLQQLRDRLGPDALRSIGYTESKLKLL
jgi:hypothetical protein